MASTINPENLYKEPPQQQVKIPSDQLAKSCPDDSTPTWRGNDSMFEDEDDISGCGSSRSITTTKALERIRRPGSCLVCDSKRKRGPKWCTSCKEIELALREADYVA